MPLLPGNTVEIPLNYNYNIELRATTTSTALDAPYVLGPQERKTVTILAGVIDPNQQEEIGRTVVTKLQQDEYL